MKQMCVECERKIDPYAAVVRAPDGKIGWVCKQCYKKLDYKDFMHPKDCQCDRCVRQR